MTWIGKKDVPFKDLGMTTELHDLMVELASDNDYWKSALSFMSSVTNREYSSLSDKQQDWLCSMATSLRIEMDKRVTKDLFSDEVANEVEF